MPPSACSASQSTVICTSPRATRSHTARSERAIRRWISWVRPDCLPLAASREARSGVEPGQHRVLGGDPAPAGAAHPGRDALLHRRRAQHLGLPERDQHRPRRHDRVVALEADRPQLVDGRARPGAPSGRPRSRRAPPTALLSIALATVSASADTVGDRFSSRGRRPRDTSGVEISSAASTSRYVLSSITLPLGSATLALVCSVAQPLVVGRDGDHPVDAAGLERGRSSPRTRPARG